MDVNDASFTNGGLVALLLALVFLGSGSAPTDDRKMQSISRDNDGGFGGYYFDSSDPTTVYVYMLDVTKSTEAEAAFRAVQPKSHQYTTVVLVQGRYSMDDLVDWFYATLRAFDQNGIAVNGAGLRPRDNGFSFTIGGDLDKAWTLVDGLEIPRDGVTLRVAGEWILLSNERDNVQAEWRPIVGRSRVMQGQTAPAQYL